MKILYWSLGFIAGFFDEWGTPASRRWLDRFTHSVHFHNGFDAAFDWVIYHTPKWRRRHGGE